MNVSRYKPSHAARINPRNPVVRHPGWTNRCRCQIKFAAIQRAVRTATDGQIHIVKQDVGDVLVLADNENAVFRVRPQVADGDAPDVAIR